MTDITRVKINLPCPECNGKMEEVKRKYTGFTLGDDWSPNYIEIYYKCTQCPFRKEIYHFGSGSQEDFHMLKEIEKTKESLARIKGLLEQEIKRREELEEYVKEQEGGYHAFVVWKGRKGYI